MKVVISSRGMSADSLIDSRFGRCAAFAVYDTENRSLDFVENSCREMDEGAGPAAVALVAGLGACKIVSGEFGFKIKQLLNDLKIQMVMMKEERTVAEIVSLLE